MSTKTKSYIGHVLWVNEPAFQSDIRKYKYYVELIKPLADELKRIGLSPLTQQVISQISMGNYSFYTKEFREKAEKDMGTVSFVFKAVGDVQIEKSLDSIKSFLDKHRRMIQECWLQHDCPVIEGYPVLTPKFEEEVRDKHSFKIRTEQASDFYGKFLIAQQAVKDLNLGLYLGNYTELDSEQGLSLTGIPDNE